MKKNIITTLICSVLFAACIGDLDVTPKDDNVILSGNLTDNSDYMEQILVKVYASFIISGQGSNGGDDIAASDGAFFTTMRALWNLQEITTDEAMCAWGDVGISDLNTQTWTPSNPFLTAVYQRLSLSVTFANDFINQCNASALDAATKKEYIAEARFLRALAYYWLIDLFGNPPFTTEVDGVGKSFPEQQTRAYVFDYIESELLAIEADLPIISHSSTASKSAAYMLLARLYLNAEVYTGQAKWAECITYTDKVISSNFSLNSNYRQNFTADNNYPENSEMIFAFEQDGKYVQGYVGTTFIIESSSDAAYIRAEDYHGLTDNTNWNGNRARLEFMNILVDTLTTYGGSPIDPADTIFAQSPDSRVLLRTKKDNNIPSAGSSGDYGIGVYKFTARNADGSLPTNYNAAFACTDFPIFRLADAYLMRAEAKFRTGNSTAYEDINMVRERAFGNSEHNIAAGDVTAELILDERAREFYYEAQRRTDLVRFGQFSNGTYKWQWKGNTMEGSATDSHLDIFPIPGDEISSNPNINQNQGYN